MVGTLKGHQRQICSLYPPQMVQELKGLSGMTRIPLARCLREAGEDLLRKYANVSGPTVQLGGQLSQGRMFDLVNARQEQICSLYPPRVALELKKLATITRVPLATYLREAAEDLLRKYAHVRAPASAPPEGGQVSQAG